MRPHFQVSNGRRNPVRYVVGAILISAVEFHFGTDDFSQYVPLILGAIAVAIILIAPDGVRQSRRAPRSPRSC